MIAYFASDLAWAMRIKACADDLGMEARPARNLESLDKLRAGGACLALIVDLSDPAPALGLIRAVREAESRPITPGDHAPRRIRILAFGPHLETQALAAARAAGADEILARGVFANQLPELLRRLDSPRHE